ncbi:uncharacterized protein SPPG_06468 [Spizellomyces punctatus DAOM BR117]|uniref:GATA-type domain-containing protein n=1 Tax=Spizellomyces punctatus (strain DAOM BR117) TaxID=645134 RepID=A0A0L0HAZ2_SPIPD|nr:uncharacterized protein SPPG_06468 [Spizellomyces punctatus DAOM BR117]KNC98054.1 hypothetical protein SPPG_06468 [Spizellomyces punctatus DAOM BR117]|eukprot:XP_016606094.1 hypothetical protein SPPG_06468 [Spizellomyces punctatus DAOM BR117]
MAHLAFSPSRNSMPPTPPEYARFKEPSVVIALHQTPSTMVEVTNEDHVPPIADGSSCRRSTSPLGEFRLSSSDMQGQPQSSLNCTTLIQKDEDDEEARKGVHSAELETMPGTGKRKRAEAVELWAKKKPAAGEAAEPRSLLVKLNLESHNSGFARKDSLPRHSPSRIKQSPTASVTPGAGEDRCVVCGTRETPQWRRGPWGPRTLCNACGVKYAAGNLIIPGANIEADHPPNRELKKKATPNSPAANERAADARTTSAKPRPLTRRSTPSKRSTFASNEQVEVATVKSPVRDVKGKASFSTRRQSRADREKTREQPDSIRIACDESDTSEETDDDNDDPALTKAKLERQIRELRRRLMVSDAINKQLEQCILKLVGEDEELDGCLAVIIRKAARLLRSATIRHVRHRSPSGHSISRSTLKIPHERNDIPESAAANLLLGTCIEEEELPTIANFCRAVHGRYTYMRRC